MNSIELRDLFGTTLRLGDSTAEQYEKLAESVVTVYNNEPAFREHVTNRSKRITETTGEHFDTDRFDVEMARAFVADEIGFPGWSSLIEAVKYRQSVSYPMVFRYAIAALWRGDFTALEFAVGGPDAFDETFIDWYERGYFENESDTFNEAFAAACWLGHEKAAAFWLDQGVDPYAGMRTGLAGFHWAASRGRLSIVKLLIDRNVPMELENMYGGTVLGQALWSAINEHTPDHGEIIERLIAAGAYVWPETGKWWEEQNVPSAETKTRVANVLCDA